MKTRPGGMLQWPHSGFHVPTGVGVPEDDRAFAVRLARSCARAPVALERMRYDPALEQVTYRSDKADGPTAGTETVDPLKFLARVVTHIPDPGQVMQRYYGGCGGPSCSGGFSRWTRSPVPGAGGGCGSSP